MGGFRKEVTRKIRSNFHKNSRKRVNREFLARIWSPNLRIRFLGDFGVQNPNLKSKRQKIKLQKEKIGKTKSKNSGKNRGALFSLQKPLKSFRRALWHDPWVRTDTAGPGEAVFAIRFDGKPIFLLKILNFRAPKFTGNFRENPL